MTAKSNNDAIQSVGLGDEQDDADSVDLELKLPDKSHLGKAYLAAIQKFAKESGLSQEAAQKLVDRDHGILTGNSEKWLKEIKADKELGGKNYETTVATAQAVLKKFGTPELTRVLFETKLGDYTEMVRLFTRVGKALKIEGDAKDAPPKRSAADILFGKQGE